MSHTLGNKGRIQIQGLKGKKHKLYHYLIYDLFMTDLFKITKVQKIDGTLTQYTFISHIIPIIQVQEICFVSPAMEIA